MSSCIYCDAPDPQPTGRTIPEGWEEVKCHGCGSSYTVPPLDPEDVKGILELDFPDPVCYDLTHGSLELDLS